MQVRIILHLCTIPNVLPLLLLVFIDNLVDEITVGPEAEFLVVPHLHRHHLLRFDYLLAVVELFQVGVLQNIQHRWPLLRVEVEGLRDHIVSLHCTATDPFLSVMGFDLGQQFKHLPPEVSLE